MECPFIDQSRPKCSEYWNMDHLSQAMEYCIYDYQECPFFRQLTRLAPLSPRPEPALAAVGG